MRLPLLAIGFLLLAVSVLAARSGGGPRDPTVALAVIVIVGGAIGLLMTVDLFRGRRTKREAADRLKINREEAPQFFRDLERRKKLPVVPVAVVLRQGEMGIFQEASTLYETRAYRLYGGGGTRIRGIYVGGGASESHQRLREIDSGNLVLTNQRLIFNGSTENRAVILRDILSASAWSDSVEISSSRKQKNQIYRVRNPLIWSQIIQMLAAGQIQVTGEVSLTAGMVK